MTPGFPRRPLSRARVFSVMRAAVITVTLACLLASVADRRASVAAQGNPDFDGDGVVDAQDCSPAEPGLATPNVFYWDEDGDQFGDRTRPLSLCTLAPFPGSVAWGDDLNDGDIAVPGRMQPRGARAIGLEFLQGPQDGGFFPSHAREIGATVLTVELDWNLIESAPGSFAGPQAAALPILDAIAQSEGFALNLSIGTITEGGLAMPADLVSAISAGTMPPGATAVQNRLNALLTFIHTSLPHAQLASLQLGRDVDRFYTLYADATFWSSFRTLFDAGRVRARELWGTSIPVSMTVTAQGFTNEPAASAMQQLLATADAVSVSYEPVSTLAAPADLSHVLSDVQRVIARAFPRPVMFQRVALTSAVTAGSSVTRQSQFIRAMFEVWDQYDALIPLMSFGPLFDTPSGPAAMRGLRTWEGAGKPKAAYHALRSLAFNRGWWNETAPLSRSFLLGLTPSLYDHNPGGAMIPGVLDNVMGVTAGSADMVTYWFDGGVPWPEAYSDTFASAELPYSAHVRETWAAFKTRQRAGLRSMVAVNPLGIPPVRLAPYWGLGEGFYQDEAFTPIGNGIIGDYTDRMLPGPWSSYALDSEPVKRAYLNYCRRIIEYFQPDYLVTGVEVNLVHDENPVLFAQWLELQRFVYQQLRANPAYARTKIVVSLVAEHFITDELGQSLIVRPRHADPAAYHLAAVPAIAEVTDVIGLSVYPIKTRYLSHQFPANFFYDLFTKLREVTDKPLGITETGFPAASFTVSGMPYVSDPAKQDRFLRILFSEVKRAGGVEFVNLYAIRDLTAHLTKLRARAGEVPPFMSAQLAEFYKFFEFMGLYDAAGQPRPGAATFDSLFRLPMIDPALFSAPVSLSSPNGQVVATFQIGPDGRLQYSLTRGGHSVLEPSPLGVIVDAVNLGDNVISLDVRGSGEVNTTYAMRGTHTVATDHHTSLQLDVRRAGLGDVAYSIEARAYDDGLAWRYVIPGSGPRWIDSEMTGWQLPAGSVVWNQPDTQNYEAYYRRNIVGTFGQDIGGPFTVELPNGAGLMTITEGRLHAYSGMTFRAVNGSNLIHSTFLDDETWIVQGGSASPWRLAIASPTLNGLVNSDMVAHVNDAPDPALFPQGVHTSWIRPGRGVWSWWTAFFSGADFEVQKQYVRHAAALRAEYVLVDAGWELGFVLPGRDQFDRLRELVEYGRSEGRNIGIWVWKAFDEIMDPAERAAFLQAVSDAGAVGIKLDNVYGDHQPSESVASLQTYESLLQEAAARRLMINYHGTHKPTGLSRTYPNEITTEGMMGLEVTGLAWEYLLFTTPQHNAAAPFVRMVAGPVDYTPVTFDPRKLGNTTITHQLATTGLFTSPLMHYADNPEVLLSQPLVLDVLRTLPTEWDETVVLPASRIGNLAAIARRKGNRWFVFAINGQNDAADLTIPLTFTGGRYDASIISDETRTSFRREARNALTPADTIAATLLPGGGLVVLLSPTPDLTRPLARGFTSLPAAGTTAGWIATYTAIRDHAEMVTHVFDDGVPWVEARQSANPALLPASLRARWATIASADAAALPTHQRTVLISPLAAPLDGSLAPYWGEGGATALPAPWSSYPLDHPDVVTAFTNYALAAIASLQPAYLGIAIDANVVLARRPDRWESLVRLLDATYRNLKTQSPSTIVFTVVSYEHLLGVAPESAALAKALASSYPGVLSSEVVKLFGSSDLAAVSSYPNSVAHNPFIPQGGGVDADYFDWAADLAGFVGRPLAVALAGASSRDATVDTQVVPGSDAGQRAFVEALLRSGYNAGAVFVINSLAVDYGTAYGAAPPVAQRAFTGLLSTDQSPKPALAPWDAMRSTGPVQQLSMAAMTAASAAPDFAAFASALSELAGSVRNVDGGSQTTGTTDTGPPTPEGFLRQQQFEALLPWFVPPPADDPTAPWNLPEPYRSMARTNVERREALMWYLAPLIEAWNTTGISPLAAVDVDRLTFKLGEYMLLAPVVVPGASSREIFLPAGSHWIDWHTGETYAGGQVVHLPAPLERLPVLFRIEVQP